MRAYVSQLYIAIRLPKALRIWGFHRGGLDDTRNVTLQACMRI